MERIKMYEEAIAELEKIQLATIDKVFKKELDFMSKVERYSQVVFIIGTALLMGC